MEDNNKLIYKLWIVDEGKRKILSYFTANSYEEALKKAEDVLEEYGLDSEKSKAKVLP